MKRIGKCNRCGFCCMMLPHWDELDDVIRAMFRMYDRNAEEVFKKVVRAKCFYLDTSGTKADGIKTKCLLFNNPKRPKFCKIFPNHPDNLKSLPMCRFKFVEL